MSVLHKEVYGQGAPIVMLHGWAMHTGVWRDFAQALAEQQQVVCLDLPGHGLSESISPYNLESVVDAIYTELPAQASVLVGWSLGGNIALRLAERYPQRIKAIVLIASNPHFVKTGSWPGLNLKVLKQFVQEMQNNSTSTLLRFLSVQVRGCADAKLFLKKIKRAMQECAPPTSVVLMGGLDILLEVDQRKALSKIDVPVQLILGEQDTLVPVEVGEQFRLLLPAIELHIIAGAGHIPFVTEQAQVLGRVREFMLRHDECLGLS